MLAKWVAVKKFFCPRGQASLPPCGQTWFFRNPPHPALSTWFMDDPLYHFYLNKGMIHNFTSGTRLATFENGGVFYLMRPIVIFQRSGN